jgi:tRNA uridine 5-carboxymethylaminomethyl modification enzyme
MKVVDRFEIVVIGGGHAGAEAAWAAANVLRDQFDATQGQSGRVALITMDPTKTGAMSCNPAIGGLAKGQIVREIDALGGLMGLAADATGIQFKVLNASKGPAVRGPRCQSDKYKYAREVQRLLATRPNLEILGGTMDNFVIENGKVVGVIFNANAPIGSAGQTADCCGEFGSIDFAGKPVRLDCKAAVLTTGTFMRALMHTGESKTQGGRVGEGSAVGISKTLSDLGLDLGRLKTGTPPRLAAETIDFASLQTQPGDAKPVPFSDMTPISRNGTSSGNGESAFPIQPQVDCHITLTNSTVHEAIRNNLDRAPMYNGQIETAGPRYCPSIEDKVVRFADKQSHHVFLEPESLETNEIYCNGISTSLPLDVQESIVASMPGCEKAKILRAGYAVEYDMVWPHQIDATCMTKSIEGLFLAGQINGTSGYEEAAGQGLLAGLNAVRLSRSETLVRLRRDQAYLGVLMDDLVTKTPREPYRMFTSRAEFRLLLRADNAAERLTGVAHQWGLVDDARQSHYQERAQVKDGMLEFMGKVKMKDGPAQGSKLVEWAKRPEVEPDDLLAELDRAGASDALARAGCGNVKSEEISNVMREKRMLINVLADIQYSGYIDRQYRQVEKIANQENTPLPSKFNYEAVEGLRNEAKMTLTKFKPTTLGQASRLAGVTPADLMLLTVSIGR